MSTPNPQDTHDPNSLLYYAPRRLRDRANALRAIQPLPKDSEQLESTAARKQQPGYDAALSENPFPKALQPANEPELIEPVALMLQRAWRNKVFAFIIPSAAVAGIAGGAAFLYAMNFSGSRNQARSTEGVDTSVSVSPQTKKAAMDQLIQRMTIPALAVEDSDGYINERLPLGVKVTDQTPGATVHLSGLFGDTKLTTGVASGVGEWRVDVNALAVTAVIPPRDFVGPMNIVAELPGHNGQPLVRGAVRLIWKPTTPHPGTAITPQTSAANATPASIAAVPETARQIDQKQIAALIKRGEELASTGDMPAARLLLQRAAEAHNAHAAFELAATYDPMVLKQLGSNSGAPDLALARAWYQRARDWGSPDAPKQLDALATADR